MSFSSSELPTTVPIGGFVVKSSRPPQHQQSSPHLAPTTTDDFSAEHNSRSHYHREHQPRPHSHSPHGTHRQHRGQERRKSTNHHNQLNNDDDTGLALGSPPPFTAATGGENNGNGNNNAHSIPVPAGRRSAFTPLVSQQQTQSPHFASATPSFPQPSPLPPPPPPPPPIQQQLEHVDIVSQKNNAAVVQPRIIYLPVTRRSPSPSQRQLVAPIPIRVEQVFI